MVSSNLFVKGFGALRFKTIKRYLELLSVDRRGLSKEKEST